MRLHLATGKESDMFYLIGARIGDELFYCENERGAFVFLNALEIGAFAQGSQKGVQAVPLEPLIATARASAGEAPMMQKIARAIVREYGTAGEAVRVSRHLPLDVADYLRAQGIALAVEEPFVARRALKTPVEIEAIADATKRCTGAFRLIEKMLQASVIEGNSLMYEGSVLTSEVLTQKVLLYFCEQGLENTDGPIISCGPHAALPHHHGAGALRSRCTIVCDLFPRDRISGYYADMTRTYIKGTPSKKAQDMYDAVARAQDAAFKVIRPGSPAKDVHEAAARAIKDAGFDVGERGFTHAVGHGLGLDLHESPSVSPRSNGTLEPGHVITIEPGLYYPEYGGVRLEDTVAITEGGYINLTNYKREFIIV